MEEKRERERERERSHKFFLRLMRHGYSTEKSLHSKYSRVTCKRETEIFNCFLLFVEIIDSLNVSKDELLLAFEGVRESGALHLRDETRDTL